MVRKRHVGAAIPQLGFAPPVGIPAGIEVLRLQQLRSRVGPGMLAVPRRPTFHHLLTLERGTLRHTVDFTEHDLRPGVWLWARPGQVQQWANLDDVDGTLIVFEPEFLDPATAALARLDDPDAPALHEPVGDDRVALTELAAHLAGSFGRHGRLPLDAHQAIHRHLLSVLLLRLTLLGNPPGYATEPDAAFRRFRDAVEHDFSRTRRLADYARTLGYSPRTLSRATISATGINAKQFIDRRTVLEAKRLLAHTDHTVAQIATRLGFSSGTNFGKYFHQRVGTTPVAFRTGIRIDSRAIIR